MANWTYQKEIRGEVMQITINDVLDWEPCNSYYTKEKLLAITSGRASLSPIEILDLDILFYIKFLVLLREPIFTRVELRLLACDFAKHVLPIWEEWARHNAPKKYLEASGNLIQVIQEFPDQSDKWATAEDVALAAALFARDARNAKDAAFSAARAAVKTASDFAWAAKVAKAARDVAWDLAWSATWDVRSAGAATWTFATDSALAAMDREKSWQIELIRKKLEERQCR
jgi:hypothetical protein